MRIETHSNFQKFKIDLIFENSIENESLEGELLFSKVEDFIKMNYSSYIVYSLLFDETILQTDEFIFRYSCVLKKKEKC